MAFDRIEIFCKNIKKERLLGSRNFTEGLRQLHGGHRQLRRGPREFVGGPIILRGSPQVCGDP